MAQNVDPYIESVAAEVVAGVRAQALPPELCKEWPTVKRILQLLAPHLPPWLRVLIPVIIAIGDKLCPGK